MNKKRRYSSKKLTEGFTLIELMIALAIFAIMATLAYGGLDSIMRADQANKQQLNDLKQIQRTFLFIEKDLRQLQNRAVTTAYAENKAAFINDNVDSNLLEISVGGYANPAGIARSSIQRVRYVLVDDRLQRWLWQYPDYPESDDPLKIPLLAQVERVSFQALEQDDSDDQNPAVFSTSDQSTTTANPIPKAVEVTIEHKKLGELTRLIAIYLP
ncbi:MAG: type II secretion system minor pseudopilin GspJ [bacterium]